MPDALRQQPHSMSDKRTNQNSSQKISFQTVYGPESRKNMILWCCLWRCWYSPYDCLTSITDVERPNVALNLRESNTFDKITIITEKKKQLCFHDHVGLAIPPPSTRNPVTFSEMDLWMDDIVCIFWTVFEGFPRKISRFGCEIRKVHEILHKSYVSGLSAWSLSEKDEPRRREAKSFFCKKKF